MMNTQRSRLPGETTFLAILLLFSAFMLWTAYGISGFESLTSAGAFPMVATAVMVITGLINYLKSRSIPPEAAQENGSLPKRFVERITPPVFLTFTLAIVVYMLALEWTGFLLTSYVFLVISMRLLGSLKMGLNLLVSALSLVAIYIVFQTVFSVLLPSGHLFQGWMS